MATDAAEIGLGCSDATIDTTPVPVSVGARKSALMNRKKQRCWVFRVDDITGAGERDDDISVILIALTTAVVLGTLLGIWSFRVGLCMRTSEVSAIADNLSSAQASYHVPIRQNTGRTRDVSGYLRAWYLFRSVS